MQCFYFQSKLIFTTNWGHRWPDLILILRVLLLVKINICGTSRTKLTQVMSHIPFGGIKPDLLGPFCPAKGNGNKWYNVTIFNLLQINLKKKNLSRFCSRQIAKRFFRFCFDFFVARIFRIFARFFPPNWVDRKTKMNKLIKF